MEQNDVVSALYRRALGYDSVEVIEEFREYDGMNIEELMQEREKLNKLLEENDDKGTK